MEMKQQIEALEAEIANKKAELRLLKKELNPRLDFAKYSLINSGKYNRVAIHCLLDALRKFVVVTSTATEVTEMFGGESMIRLGFTNSNQFVSKLPAEKRKVCASMVNDIFPIFEKYTNIFIEMNRDPNADAGG